MSNAAQNLNPSPQSPSPDVTERQILEHPAANWSVANSRGGTSDVDCRVTTLLATINGKEVRLVQVDYDNSPGSASYPDRIGSTGSHHWNYKHELFDRVARGIEQHLGEEVGRAATDVLALIRDSDPYLWEMGPTAEYRGGQFNFGGYRRSFNNYSGSAENSDRELCREGFVGRIGFTSVLVRIMADGSTHGEVAVSQGDLYKTARLTETAAQRALEALRSKGL